MKENAIKFCQWAMDNYYLQHGDWCKSEFKWRERDKEGRRFRDPNPFTSEEIYALYEKEIVTPPPDKAHKQYGREERQ